MADEKSNIHYLNFENRKIPDFIEMKGKDWIKYGEKNDYPYYLISLYLRSSMNCAIINDKVNYIAGSGWTYDKHGVVTIGQRAVVEKLITQPFADTSLDETTLKWAKDFEIFNGFAILVRWSKNRKSATLEHIDFANVRANSDRTKFAFTRGWYRIKNGNRTENKDFEKEKDFMVYSAYDPKNRKGDQLYYYTSFHPDQYVYPVPYYIGGVSWIENHVRYTDFQYTNISSSFSPSIIVNIYGTVPGDEIQSEITSGIKSNFTGAEGQRVIVAFHPSRELGTEAVPIAIPDQSQLYQTIADQSMLNIFTSHSYPKILIGITTEGALGQRNETITAEEVFHNKYVRTRQIAIENCINEIANDIGLGLKLKLNRTRGTNWMPSDQDIARIIGDEGLAQIIEKELGIIAPSKKILMGSHKQKIAIFTRHGVDADDYEILFERDLKTADRNDIEKFEADFLHMSFADVKIISLDRSIIDLLSKDGMMPPEEMAKTLKVSIGDVRDSIARLTDRKLLKSTTENIGGVETTKITVSENALSELEKKPANTANIKVMYRYDLSKNAPDLVAGGKSRPFCVDLMSLNKLYSREDINMMSDAEDRNIWEEGGGWYHNPETDVNVPHCRHTWRQVVVREKIQ